MFGDRSADLDGFAAAEAFEHGVLLLQASYDGRVGTNDGPRQLADGRRLGGGAAGVDAGERVAQGPDDVLQGRDFAFDLLVAPGPG